MKMFADKPCQYARRAPPHTLFHLRLVGIGNDGLQMFCTISGLLQFTLRFQRRESEHPQQRLQTPAAR